MLLSIVVPCYNEEAVLGETGNRLDALLASLESKGKVAAGSAVYFVDDGSKDRTWELIRELGVRSARLRGLKLSRNRGHQVALLAGLESAPGDAIVSVDADLQDDLAAIEKMVDAFHAGADVVYGVRKSRTVDTGFKRFTAEGYYKLLNALGAEVVFNHADFRLLSRRAIEALRRYEEANVFLRGLIPQIGFKSAVVEYDRGERFAGESKYPLRKMLALAWNGITSFSAVPLRAITAIGFGISLISIGIALWAVWLKLFTDLAVPGWASTVVPLYFLGGVQLLSIGVLGEYLAKTYIETKRRPKYFIESVSGESTPRG